MASKTESENDRMIQSLVYLQSHRVLKIAMYVWHDADHYVMDYQSISRSVDSSRFQNTCSEGINLFSDCRDATGIVDWMEDCLWVY